MAVATLTDFPAKAYAGDTIRVTLGAAEYPSDEWTLQVLLRGPDGTIKTYAAQAGADDGFDLVITASQTAKLAAGHYAVTKVYTEISSEERKAIPDRVILFIPNPTQEIPKSDARLALEAMKSAFKKLAGGQNSTVSFNGQTFTKRNLSDFQTAIARQQAIVDSEAGSTSGGIGKILHPL